MLNVENLSVNYGHITAVRNISLHVGEKEIVALIGANGAGKTSTLMAISGMVEKTTGRVEFNGKDISDLAPDRVVRLGLVQVPEGRHIFPGLSVQENLITGTISAGKMSAGEISARIDEQYQLFPRLKERRNQAAGTLSGGEQQMVAISRALMSGPKLIMLDEPSLGLAPIVVEEIFELILRIRDSGMTVLLIEQNAAMTLSICDHAYTLELGSIAISGTGKELLSSDEVRRAYLGI